MKKLLLHFSWGDCLFSVLWICLILSLLTSTLVHSQISREYQFDHISLEQGLSQSSVYSILQDYKGFLWVGTEDGLNKFDGYSFKVYRHSPDNKRSIAGNFIQVIHEDRDSILWLGLEGAGLSRFDRKTETFTAFRSIPQDTLSLSHNNVRAIYDDQHGSLWLGTLNGISIFDKKHGISRRIFHNSNNPKGLSHNVVTSFFADKHGALWVGTWGGGLNKYDKRTNSFKVYKNEHHPQGLGNDFVRCIFEDHAGVMWVGTAGGLFSFDTQTEHFTQYINNWKNPNSVSGNTVQSIVEDQNNVLWVATLDGGVSLLSEDRSRWTQLMQNNNNPHSLSSNMGRVVYPDRSGIVWVGTSGGGLNKYDPKSKKFITIANELNNPNSLSNNVVRAIFETNDGNVWVGTEGGGLNFVNTQNGKVLVYRHSPSNPTGISHNIIRAVYQDTDGFVWIGTGGGGLNKLDPRTGKFYHYRASKQPNSLHNNFIRCLYEDKQGVLWIGTDGSGLERFDKKNGTFTLFSGRPGEHHSLQNNNIVSLYEDKAGVFWVGTLGGLHKFDRKTGQCEVFIRNPDDHRSMHSNNIRAMLEDSKGRFWLATWGGGLHLFDRSSGLCKVYREKDGLPNDAVYGLIEDSKGNIWLSTNHGLGCFNPDTEKFIVFDAADGLQSVEFNGGAYHHGKSGNLYFGGVKGLNVFSPEQISYNTFIPPVLITGIKKFNKPVMLGAEPDELPELRIPASDNFINIHYAALNFTHSEKNLYKYRMEGFDEDWIDAGTKREANYTNLHPGTYTFRVLASNNDGLWNLQGASLKIVILPPWWQTAWFKVSLMICFVGTGGTLLWSKLHQFQRKNEELERLVAERTVLLEESNKNLSDANHEVHQHLQVLSEQAWEIATINTELQERNQQLEILNHEKNEFLSIAAHDLKNPLTSIILTTELVQYSIKTFSREKILEKIGIIASTALQMRNIISSILDLNAIESGKISIIPETINLSSIVTDIVAEYMERAYQKSINLHLQMPDNELLITTDVIKTREVIDNILSNAIKYSPAQTNVQICVQPILRTPDPLLFELEHNHTSTTRDTGFLKPTDVIPEPVIRILIRDEGPGLSKDDQKLLFQRFTRLTPTPTGGESSTGLGLSIVKKLVEVMHGSIYCESEQGKGSTFIVEFCDLNHLLPKPNPEPQQSTFQPDLI